MHKSWLFLLLKSNIYSAFQPWNIGTHKRHFQVCPKAIISIYLCCAYIYVIFKCKRIICSLMSHVIIIIHYSICLYIVDTICRWDALNLNTKPFNVHLNEVIYIVLVKIIQNSLDINVLKIVGSTRILNLSFLLEMLGNVPFGENMKLVIFRLDLNLMWLTVVLETGN